MEISPNTFTIVTPGGSRMQIDPEMVTKFIFAIGEQKYELVINKM